MARRLNASSSGRSAVGPGLLRAAGLLLLCGLSLQLYFGARIALMAEVTKLFPAGPSLDLTLGADARDVG